MSLNANAKYSLLVWEPIQGSGERFNVGAICQHNGSVSARPLIRPDILRCIYGPTAGDSIMQLINQTLESSVDTTLIFSYDEAIDSPFFNNLSFSKPRSVYAIDENDLYRQIILMNCSLCSLPNPDSQTIAAALNG